MSAVQTPGPGSVVTVDTGTTVVHVTETADTPPRPLYVTEEQSIIVTSERGPQGANGPAGPAGKDGSGDAHYVYEQDNAAARWVCAHPLGKRPSVAIIDSAGTALVADITYPDEATVRVDFVAPTSGRLILN